MPSDNFDITSFLTYEPPKYTCAKCCAIWSKINWQYTKSGVLVVVCPICNVLYRLDFEAPDLPYSCFQERLRDNGQQITFDDLIEHTKSLALLAEGARSGAGYPSSSYAAYSPMRAILKAMMQAQNFIHFMSLGISDQLIGALKAAAQRVNVRGVVSNVDDRQAKELTNYRGEAPNLDVIAFPKWQPGYHQKLFIVDGLLAFTGAANLTTHGLRNSASDVRRDGLVIVTDVSEIMRINNYDFSNARAKHSQTGSEILFGDLPF